MRGALAQKNSYYTPEEYLALEEQAVYKSEYSETTLALQDIYQKVDWTHIEQE